MLSNRKNLLLIGCFLIVFLPSLFLGFKGGIKLITIIDDNKKVSNGQSPIKNLRITVSKNQRNELIDQLQRFADKDAFAIRIERHDPNGYNFSVYLWRDDIWMSGLYPVDPETMSLHFYYTIEAQPIPASIVDETISDLENYLNEIPNATISIEK